VRVGRRGERPQPCRSYFDKLNTNGSSVRPEPRAKRVSRRGERPQPCCSYFDKLNTNGSSVRPEPRASESVEGPALSLARSESVEGGNGLSRAVHISTSSIRTVLPFALSLARSESVARACPEPRTKRVSPRACPEPRAKRVGRRGERPQPCRSYFDKLNTNGSSVRPEPRASESVQGPALSLARSESVEGGNGLSRAVHISTSSIRTVLPFALSLARSESVQGPALSLARASRSKGLP
jgi:hypothetical protein